jgi:hypothetical protein
MSRRARRERRGKRPPARRPRHLRAGLLVAAAVAIAAVTLWTAMRWRPDAPGVPAAPRDPLTLRSLALAEHNQAWVASPSAPERAATRTSLERIVMEKRALALLDSSAATARTPEEWARAQYWSGMVHENLGLVTDALRLYAGIHARAPGTTPALAHATALMGYLRDPRPAAAPSSASAATEAARP